MDTFSKIPSEYNSKIRKFSSPDVREIAFYGGVRHKSYGKAAGKWKPKKPEPFAPEKISTTISISTTN